MLPLCPKFPRFNYVAPSSLVEAAFHTSFSHIERDTLEKHFENNLLFQKDITIKAFMGH